MTGMGREYIAAQDDKKCQHCGLLIDDEELGADYGRRFVRFSIGSDLIGHSGPENKFSAVL